MLAQNQKIDPSTRPVNEPAEPATLPRITVITPSMNQAQYLEHTIRSIVDQNYPNLEWFLVDGGSTDGSVDIIKKYEKHFAWYVSEKDRNQSDAINKGYQRATGEICCYVNSDDVLEPGALHYAARAFTPQVNWIVGWAKYFDNSGDEWVYGPQRCREPIDMFLHNPVPQIASFWRTSALKLVGPISEDYSWSLDYEYWMRLYFEAGWRPTYVRRCLGGFRLHMESKSIGQPDRFAAENGRIHAKYESYLTVAQRRELARRRRQEAAKRSTTAMWEALEKHDVTAARRHAIESVRNQKFSFSAWRTLALALRGH